MYGTMAVVVDIPLIGVLLSKLQPLSEEEVANTSEYHSNQGNACCCHTLRRREYKKNRRPSLSRN